MKQRIAAALSAFAIVIGIFAAAHPAAAATFNSNRIIDDTVFNNAGSMPANQIDAFLNQFPNSCISTNHGFSAVDPTGYSPSGGFTFGGLTSAGNIISHAASAYDINPQVLVATLQKEQGLVDGGIGCSTLRYTGATGYGCPDSGTTYSYSSLNLYAINGTMVTSVSGTCVNSASKAGFSQQVIRAAWLLKFGQQRSKGNVNWAIVRGSWDNSDDLSSCYGGPMTQGTYKVCPNGTATFYDGYKTIDGQAVHMDTGATAALYWYTPHFHGNQVFDDVFTSWFGSVYGVPSNLNLQFENLDGGTGAVSGSTGQVGNYAQTITVGTSVHVFFYDIAGGNLRHGWTDNAGWHFETIDGAGGGNGQVNADVGGMPYPIVYNNQLYVAYHDFTDGTLRLASQSGGVWSVQTLDGAAGAGGRTADNVAWDINIAVQGNGINIFYSDATNGDLRHAWSGDGTNWFFEILDGQPAAVSHYDGNTGQGVTGMFINGDLHLLYYDGNGGNLRHAYYNGGWHFEDVDGQPNAISHFNSNVGFSPSFVWWQNSIQAFYQDPSRGVVRHAWADGRGWHFEDLDGAPYAISHYYSNLGMRSSIVPQGTTLNVFYYDAAQHGIRQAWDDPVTGWHFTNVDGQPDAISGVANPVGERFGTGLFNSEVQLYYFDVNTQSLKHAFGPLAP
jgi:hypothetical protein